MALWANDLPSAGISGYSEVCSTACRSEIMKDDLSSHSKYDLISDAFPHFGQTRVYCNQMETTGSFSLTLLCLALCYLFLDCLDQWRFRSPCECRFYFLTWMREVTDVSLFPSKSCGGCEWMCIRQASLFNELRTKCFEAYLEQHDLTISDVIHRKSSFALSFFVTDLWIQG